MKRIAHALGTNLRLLVVESPAEPYVTQLDRIKPPVPVEARTVPTWSAALAALRDELRREDLVVVLGARRHTVAWHPFLSRLPARLASLVPESFLTVYPAEQVEGRVPRIEEGMPRSLTRTRIVADLPGRSAHTALDALLQRQFPKDAGRRRDVLRTLLHSHRGATLELTPGVVVAHARVEFLKAPQLYLGRAASGIPFPAIVHPVSLVFLLLSPTDQPGEHLAVLAEVARLMASSERVEALRASATEDEMAAALVAGARPAADLTTG